MQSLIDYLYIVNAIKRCKLNKNLFKNFINGGGVCVLGKDLQKKQPPADHVSTWYSKISKLKCVRKSV